MRNQRPPAHLPCPHRPGQGFRRAREALRCAVWPAPGKEPANAPSIPLSRLRFVGHHFRAPTNPWTWQMADIKPERMLSDLRTLATFGAYKSGVHRPTLSEQDVAAREWFVARMREAGLDASIDGIANILGKSPATGRKAPLRLAPGKPELRRMARRALGVRLRAGGGARHLRGSRNAAPWRRRRGVLRRGGPFRQLPGQPLVHRPARGERDRQCIQSSDGHFDARGREGRRLVRPSTPPDRTCTLRRVLRGAYRAGRHA